MPARESGDHWTNLKANLNNPTEIQMLTERLAILDQRIESLQASVIQLQLKALPVEDAEQTLLSLLETRRFYAEQLDGLLNR